MKFIIIIVSVILTLIALDNTLFQPLPLKTNFNSDKALLGKMLFSDKNLSRTGEISCESCHKLTLNGADVTPTSDGVEGRKGQFNSPSVYNAIFNFKQFWDGRAEDLKSQIVFPITNHFEMDSTLEETVKRVSQNRKYRDKFIELYGEISFENITDAINEFEKSLITPNSLFDRYLKGLYKFSKREREGFKLFKEKGCVSCHHGINIGGNMFQKFGVMIEKSIQEYGRYNVTGREQDKHFFKVPSLRNITLTAPYFHDGSVDTLKKAIALMGYHQLGITMSNYEIESIEIFFKTLEGELPNTIFRTEER